MAIQQRREPEKPKGPLLVASVSIHNAESGESTTYLRWTPKSEIPAEDAKQMGEHCWGTADDLDSA